MRFDWDPAKDAANRAKHGLSFAAASLVFEAADTFTWHDRRHDYGEDRHLVIGELPDGTVVVVAYTRRGTVIRLISARKASRRERRMYHASIKEAP